MRICTGYPVECLDGKSDLEELITRGVYRGICCFWRRIPGVTGLWHHSQVLVNFLTSIPSVITNAIISNLSITNDAVVWAKLQFAYGITLIFFYSYFAVSVKRVLINNVLSDYLEFILHLYLCIGTISSTTNLCFNQNTYSTMETTNSSNDKWSESRSIDNGKCQYSLT